MTHGTGGSADAAPGAVACAFGRASATPMAINTIPAIASASSVSPKTATP